MKTVIDNLLQNGILGRIKLINKNNCIFYNV